MTTSPQRLPDRDAGLRDLCFRRRQIERAIGSLEELLELRKHRDRQLTSFLGSATGTSDAARASNEEEHTCSSVSLKRNEGR